MAKKRERHDLSTFGGRLSFFRERAGYTQVRLAEELHTTRQLVAAWERNDRNSYQPYLKEISAILNVEENVLLNGVPLKDQTVADELGLNSDSIDFLKLLASSKDGSPVPVGWSDGWTKEEETLFTSPDLEDGQGVEAVYPDEILEITNTLLGSVLGRQLLALCYKFVKTDFSLGVVRVPDEDFKEVVSVCSEAEFTSLKNGKKILVPFSVLRFGLGQEILRVLDEIRKEG